MDIQLPAGRFYGKTARIRRVRGFRFTEVAYAQGSKLPTHSHELAKFCFVVSGTFRESLGKQSHVRPPRALTFQPAAIDHAEVHETAGRHFLIEIERQRMDHATRCLTNIDRHVELRGFMPLHLASRLYQEFSSTDLASTLVMEGLALELLAEVARSSLRRTEGLGPAWLNQIVDTLRTRFTEPLSLDDLAAMARVHPIYLARAFRKSQGCSVGDFVRRLRVEAALGELSTSDNSLAEIAAAAGFADQSHFCRIFKRYAGMSPGEYRLRFRRC
jgi:AraC family transcriptional regulator